MKLQLSNLDKLFVSHGDNPNYAFGGNQSWYRKYWHRMAGCGPTSGATVTAYLAQTNPELKALYPYPSMEKNFFIEHMDRLYSYITPGPMGVHQLNMYIKGILDYSHMKKTPLLTHAFSTETFKHMQKDRSALIDFLNKAFLLDSPIAFLNLDRGQEVRLQNWHWITITSVDIRDDAIWATASDEGSKRVFNLENWFMTSPKHGGLIAFSKASVN